MNQMAQSKQAEYDETKVEEPAAQRVFPGSVAGKVVSNSLSVRF